MKGFKKVTCILIIFLFVLSSNFIAVLASSPLTVTPIHSYNFNNDTGTTISDSTSDTAVNGTVTGTSLITGYDGTGGARHFEAGNTIAFSGKIIPKGKKSISFWIRKSSYPTGDNMCIFSNLKDRYTETDIWGMMYPSGRIYIKNNYLGSDSVVSSTTNICDNEWHHVLYTWDGTANANAIKLYIDDMTTPEAIATSPYTETTAYTNNLYIGSTAQGTSANLVADIDNFEVYNEIYVNSPVGVTATNGPDTNQINVSWNPVPGATVYNILRSVTSGTGYTQIGSSTTASYLDSDTALTSGMAYYYVITAIQSGIESEYSSEASFTLLNMSNTVLVITMDNGMTKEYNLTYIELEDFIAWYDNSSIGVGKGYYVFSVKGTISPFINIKNFIPYSKILYFEVKEYN